MIDLFGVRITRRACPKGARIFQNLELLITKRTLQFTTRKKW